MLCQYNQQQGSGIAHAHTDGDICEMEVGKAFEGEINEVMKKEEQCNELQIVPSSHCRERGM